VKVIERHLLVYLLMMPAASFGLPIVVDGMVLVLETVILVELHSAHH
jgi:hypothetical protein